MTGQGVGRRSDRVRAHALEIASALFYANGVRAVGMEQIVAQSGTAKTTIYRHFPTKDALIAAFLQKEDDEFWAQWDAVIATAGPGRAGLVALGRWIGERVRRDGYRGCPQLNVAAEFADPAHPARIVAEAHKAEMHHRLTLLCGDAGVAGPDRVAAQIALLFDGAFLSGSRFVSFDSADLLRDAVEKLLAG